MSARGWSSLLAALLVGVAGCESGVPSDPSGSPAVASPVIVSNPVSGAVQATATGASALRGPLVAYVSFRPGAFPSGETAGITNRRTAAGVLAEMVDGGLDPMPIPAEAGDTLAFTILGAGIPPVRFVRVVPPSVAVMVVRTEPPSGGRDVPLNIRARILFSEPVIPASVVGNVRVERGGTPVDGQVAVSADGLAATFEASQELLPGTGYTLVATMGIHDTDGSAIAGPLAVEFVTGPGEGAFVPTGSLVLSTAEGLRLVRADGAQLGVLTRLDPAAGLDHGPAWSPDGARIAFARHDGLWGAEIHLVNGDGTGFRRLSPPGAYDAAPTWSPDGRLIAFEHREDSAAIGHIYVMEADGASRLRLTSNGQPNAEPAWAPDGSRIAYRTFDETGHEGLFLMDPDGSGRVRLTPAALVGAREPAWSPDGRRLAFSAYAATGAELFAIDADGGRLVQLTAGLGGVMEPSWSADGRYVAFGVADGCEHWHSSQCPTPLAPLWVLRVSDRRLYPVPYAGFLPGSPSWRP